MSILHFILPEVSVLLKSYVKNPTLLASLKAILTEINSDISAILSGLQ